MPTSALGETVELLGDQGIAFVLLDDEPEREELLHDLADRGARGYPDHTTDLTVGREPSVFRDEVSDRPIVLKLSLSDGYFSFLTDWHSAVTAASNMAGCNPSLFSSWR
jgi:hypothetical protein